MNIDSVIQKVISLNKTKFGTLEFLIEYFKDSHVNIFKVSQLAEDNKQFFIGLVQEHISYCNNLNIVPLFININPNVFTINNDFAKVLQIKNQLYQITWQEFEQLCAVLIKKCFNGYNVEVTQASNDGGIDFSAIIPFKSNLFNKSYGNIELYGQAKQYQGNVQRTDIDKFTAFANRNKRDNQYPAQLFVFCTTSDYNTNAKFELNSNHFISFNGIQLASLIFEYQKDISKNNNTIVKDFLNN